MTKSYQAHATEELYDYIERTFHPEDSTLGKIRERSEKAGLPSIQVGSMDGLHLEVLASATQPRKIVEIGTLGGYSGTHLARALQPGGKLFTFEYEPRHAEVARQSFKDAGVAEKTEIFLGEALKNLPKIESEGPFDVIFIDADKPNYPRYLAWAEKNIRVGGMIIGDNTFGWGLITASSFSSEEERTAILAVREFNQRLAQNDRFKTTILPTGEGLTVAIRLR
jgi:caffeoyl-CoA O-methyltransferase